MRFQALTPETAPAKAKDALAEIAERRGGAGPMTRMMANSPALLRGYLDLSRAGKRVGLDRALSERISLAVQAEVGCAYCIRAHSRAARGLGIPEAEIEAALEARSPHGRVEALLDFAVGVLRAPAAITDRDVEQLRAIGYSDRDLADVVLLVALNQLTGSFNLVAGLEPGGAATELAA